MKIGSENLQKPAVMARIAQAQTKRLAKVEVSADYVLQNIKNVIERCSQGEQVLDSRGHPTGEWKFDSKAVLKGNELLGKHLKMFSDKLEVTGANGGPIAHTVSPLLPDEAYLKAIGKE